MQDRKAGALRLKIWLPRTWNEETCAGLCTTSGTHSSVRRYNTRRRVTSFRRTMTSHITRITLYIPFTSYQGMYRVIEVTSFRRHLPNLVSNSTW